MHCEYNMERLIELFCDNLSIQKSDPFEGDVVVCQSKTMEQYLNKSIADEKVIAANIEYRFMRNSINDILSLCPEPDTKLVSWLDPESMIWEIYGLLPELEATNLYPPLKEYIHADDASQDFRRYQLSLQITSVFDKYIGYRGDWLELWQKNEKATSGTESKNSVDLGPHEEWQADLWRKLTVEKKEKVTFLRSSRMLGENIQKIKSKISNNISIFGISNLPQDYIDFFATLKKEANLHFYYLMPCVEYWGDITRAKAILEGDGNRLLASWGMVGRDFFELLLNKEYDISQPEKKLDEPLPTDISLLKAIQYDIMRNLPLKDSIIKGDEIIKNDTSITINNSYSRMREVEILHDYILDLLNNKTCELSNIVVMAPNIEDYAPYIQAVFKQSPSERSADSGIDEPYISYKLADCSTLFTSTEAETFMKLLQLPDSKMSSLELFEIISSEPVMRKFGFAENDIDIIYELIVEANIAWGRDSEHRKEILKDDYTENNTWEFGFNRMLAGYAFDCEGTVHNGTLPLSLSSSKAIIAGELIAVCKKIFDFSDKMRKLRTPDSWYQDIFLEIISAFFELYGQKNEEILPLKQAVESFKNNCEKANFEKELPLEVVRAAIEKEFKDQGTGKSSFFRGGVTFCQLLPMRNIPFKTICVIGMNDGEFPRIDSKNGFNLALKEFRRGDRSLRNEDRYIFLETLLACQENFYISYIGQSQSDNEELAPSVIVDELLDYIESLTNVDKKEMVVKHPLHGFDEKYFSKKVEGKTKSLYSYSKINLRAAESVADSEKKPIDALFCPTDLPLTSNTPNEFSFNDFVSFFLSPGKFFLRYILNINLYEEFTESLQTTEPFEINTLDNYHILDESLEHKLKNKGFDISENLKASGMIPFGVWGDEILTKAEDISGKLFDEISELGEKQKTNKPVVINFEVNNFKFTLSGTFDNIYENGQAFFRPGSLKEKDKLKAWIWHQLAIKAGLDIPETVIIGMNKDDVDVQRILAISEPEQSENVEVEVVQKIDHMTTLSEIFVCGLSKPLPLFIHSSSEYIKGIHAKKPLTQEDALKKASAKWEKPYQGYEYDLSENANLICFGESPPPLNDALKDEFVELAEAIFAPLANEVRK